MTSDPITTQRRPRTLALAIGAAIAVAALSVAAYAFTRDRVTQPASTIGEAPPTLTIAGTLQVDGLVSPAWQLGAECTTTRVSGGAGYEDIRAGANVTITDTSGTTIALGTLEPGTVVVHPTIGDPAKTCVFGFEITGVPAGHGIYGVEVSHRGVVEFREADLDEPVKLELG